MTTLTFSQGIVSHSTTTGNPGDPQNFLVINGDKVDLHAPLDQSLVTVLAHRDSHYLLTLQNSSDIQAWGYGNAGNNNFAFDNTQGGGAGNNEYYLWMDINRVTGETTYGHSVYEPASGATPPFSNVNRPNDQHWFDTNQNVMKVWRGAANSPPQFGTWVEVVRVFVGKYIYSSAFSSLSINAPSFIGTHVGMVGTTRAGALIYDVIGKPVLRTDANGISVFFTTEDVFTSGLPAMASPVSGNRARYETFLVDALGLAPAPAYSVVRFDDFNQVSLLNPVAQPTSLWGMIEFPIGQSGDLVQVTMSGVVRNPVWDWSTIGQQIFADKDNAGQLVTVEDDGYVPLPDQLPVAVAIDQKAILLRRPELALTTGGTTGGGVTSHSALTDLGSDDHPQYHTDPRGDLRYYLKTELDLAVSGSPPSVTTGAKIDKVLGTVGNFTSVLANGNVSDSGFNGASFLPSTTTLNDFIPGSPQSDLGDVLTYNGSVWVAQPSSAGVTDHLLLTNIGTNSHAQIDTHIADATIHFTQASISITESQISNLGSYLENVSEDLTPQLGGDLDVNGNTIIGLSATPTLNTEATSKAYVDSLAGGFDPKESVRLATVNAGGLAVETGNGWASSGFGVGKTLTQTGVNSASIDGVPVVNNDRILVKNESGGLGATHNGIYVVSGVAGTEVVLTRATDQDGSPSAEVSGGNFTFVEQGTQQGNQYVVVHNGLLTVDTDAMNWSQVGGAAGTFPLGNLTDVDDIQAHTSGLRITFQGDGANLDTVINDTLHDAAAGNVSVTAGVVSDQARINITGSAAQYHNGGAFAIFDEDIITIGGHTIGESQDAGYAGTAISVLTGHGWDGSGSYGGTNAGALTLRTGIGGDAGINYAGGDGGGVLLVSGSGGDGDNTTDAGDGGTINITAGDGGDGPYAGTSAAGDGGSITIAAGNGGDSYDGGTGGSVIITSGDAENVAGVQTDAGDISLTTGDSFNNDGAGDINLTVGSSNGNGADGFINLIAANSSNTAELHFLERSAFGTDYVGLKAPDSVTTTEVYTLPAADGTLPSEALRSDGSGTLSFSPVPYDIAGQTFGAVPGGGGIAAEVLRLNIARPVILDSGAGLNGLADIAQARSGATGAFTLNIWTAVGVAPAVMPGVGAGGIVNPIGTITFAPAAGVPSTGTITWAGGTPPLMLLPAGTTLVVEGLTAADATLADIFYTLIAYEG